MVVMHQYMLSGKMPVKLEACAPSESHWLTWELCTPRSKTRTKTPKKSIMKMTIKKRRTRILMERESVRASTRKYTIRFDTFITRSTRVRRTTRTTPRTWSTLLPKSSSSRMRTAYHGRTAAMSRMFIGSVKKRRYGITAPTQPKRSTNSTVKMNMHVISM